MADKHSSGTPEQGPEDVPADAPPREDHGRYVEGSYGKAGKEGGHVAHTPEGQYTEGDYGESGEAGAHGDRTAGRFVEADYGDAGKVPGRKGTDAIGQYEEGDYGETGQVPDVP
jgi:hypothetical protein